MQTGAILSTVALAVLPSRRWSKKAVPRRGRFSFDNALVLGAGEAGQLVARTLLQHPEHRINVIGFVAGCQPAELRPEVRGVPILGEAGEIRRLIRAFAIQRLLVTFSDDVYWTEHADLGSLPHYELHLDTLPRLFDPARPPGDCRWVDGVPLGGVPDRDLSRSATVAKRAIDVIGSLTGLILLVPFFAYAAFRIKFESPGPVLFRQLRMGADDKPFTILKFRTMSLDAEGRKAQMMHLNMYRELGDTRMFKIRNDPRVTRFGSFLRRHSLDELPQLINVLTGAMSLVGPRPLVLEEDQYVPSWARCRLEMKPGLTGPWQVFGRNAVPFAEMVKLDYLYVNNWSVRGDVRLILRTIPLVIRPSHDEVDGHEFRHAPRSGLAVQPEPMTVDRLHPTTDLTRR
jgi:exopolysaccharide biosynthesis polyprenyl glycosylphosphotransferase